MNNYNHGHGPQNLNNEVALNRIIKPATAWPPLWASKSPKHTPIYVPRPLRWWCQRNATVAAEVEAETKAEADAEAQNEAGHVPFGWANFQSRSI